MQHILIYGTKDCVYCSSAKDLAEDNNLTVTYKKIKNRQDENFEEMQTMLGLCDVKLDRITVPQIFQYTEKTPIGTRKYNKLTYIGGYNEFQNFINEDT